MDGSALVGLLCLITSEPFFMGVVVLTVIGAVMGWLAAVLVRRDDRVGTSACAIAGLIGVFAGALLVGSVPLTVGLSAEQLLFGVLTSALAIVALNVLAFRALPTNTQ